MTSASTAAPTAAQDRLTYENPTYENLTGDHDWETHLPPSPEGELLVSADYCTECGAGLRLLLDQDGAILAARLDQQSGQQPGQQHGDKPCSPNLFTLQNGRMEPADSDACRLVVREHNHGSEPAWSIAPVPVQDGNGSPRRYRPLGPEMTPAFGEMLRQHRWREEPGGSPYRGRHVHDCSLCRARMHVSLDRRGRVAMALVELPASRECHYLGDENGVTAVTDAEFYGEEPQRVTAA